MSIIVIGIDLAKNIFAVHGVNENGHAELVKPKVSREQLLPLIAHLPPCTIGMEACAGSTPLGTAVSSVRPHRQTDGAEIRHPLPRGWPSRQEARSLPLGHDAQNTKAGDHYLRSLLVMGARAVLNSIGDKQDYFSCWARDLVARRGYWRAVVAIAAKNARVSWAVLHYGEDFHLNKCDA